MRRILFLATTFVLGAVGSARAESRSLRIDYEAARSCPDERRFVELARARVEQWATIEQRGELVARVRAEDHDGSFVGRMSLEDATGTSFGSRTIQEANCEDVVLALALFLAFALEADASHTRVPTGTTDDAPPSRSSAEVHPPVDVREPPSPHSPPSRSAAKSAVVWQLVARTHAVVGRMPSAVPGAALAIEVGPRPQSSMFRPYGSLGIDAAPYSQHREGRGRVELGWAALFARACVGLDFTSRARLGGEDAWLEPWVCARAEAGTLRAASRGYAVNRTEYLASHAAGAEAGAAVRLSQMVSVGAFVQAMAPIVRHELVLGENRVFRAPSVTGEAGFELRIKF